jgi:hypothetical protein
MKLGLLAVMLVAMAPVVSAAPKVLECTTKSADPLAHGETYQITFDEAASTVSINGGTPAKAIITGVRIEWVSEFARWRIDRVTGEWSSTQVGGVNNGWISGRGRCSVARSRSF